MSQPDPAVKPLGRPGPGEVRERMRVISFRADVETVAALEKLEARVEAHPPRRRRSEALRRLILGAAVQFPSKKK